jgi:hypothetical protein|nr:MAG TPA: hypothetical protein [Caudoviricetes sp.]
MSDEVNKHNNESYLELKQNLKDLKSLLKDAWRHIKKEDLSEEYSHLIFEVTPGYLGTIAKMFNVPEEHKDKFVNLSIVVPKSQEITSLGYITGRYSKEELDFTPSELHTELRNIHEAGALKLIRRVDLGTNFDPKTGEMK